MEPKQGLPELALSISGLVIHKKHPSDKIIALAGNPNVGKSTVFNALTGLHQHTGNWPGKTVMNAQGYFEHKGRGYILVDLPGCYSLRTRSEEEVAAHNFLCYGHPDGVIVVCDGSCLERNLNLALQILEMGQKVILCVNLLDEAEKRGMKFRLDLLSKRLGVPVVGTAAREGKGLPELLQALEVLDSCNSHPALPDFLVQTRKLSPETQTSRNFRFARQLCEEVVEMPPIETDRADRKLDNLFTSKFTGFPIMLLMLLGIFWITIWGANIPSDLLADLLFSPLDGWKATLTACNVNPAFISLLLDGVYRVTAWVISVMLPPMAIFFPLFTLLEDFGYLPRVAFNLDRCFKNCGACGKQALTMCMGFGCNAAGITGCRIIDSPRERLIAMITNNFVPCNGRFPTLITIITLFLLGTSEEGPLTTLKGAGILVLVILLGVVLTLAVSKLLSHTVLKGVPSSFTLELPPYRRPQIFKVLIRSILDRTIKVLGRAVTAVVPAGLIIWIMANVTVGQGTLLQHLTGFLDPLGHLMGLDGTILAGFILGLPANEIVMPLIIMTYLQQGSLLEISGPALHNLLVAHGWTWNTAVCMILFTLLHWPCATTLLTMHKESQSLRWTAMAFLVPTICGILLCMLVHVLLKLAA
ncbi:ferrous iron transporter B [Acidaminococcus sp.]|uniref:ferrous iron transporter B n=1 Tax=Acidaminococcus sp. TaxID=1872103 RepID=UPI003D7DE746